MIGEFQCMDDLPFRVVNGLVEFLRIGDAVTVKFAVVKSERITLPPLCVEGNQIQGLREPAKAALDRFDGKLRRQSASAPVRSQ